MQFSDIDFWKNGVIIWVYPEKIKQTDKTKQAKIRITC